MMTTLVGGVKSSAIPLTCAATVAQSAPERVAVTVSQLCLTAVRAAQCSER